MSIPLGDPILGSWFDAKEAEPKTASPWEAIQRELQDMAKAASITDKSSEPAGLVSGYRFHEASLHAKPETFGQTNLATTFRPEPISANDLIDQRISAGSAFSQAMTAHGFAHIVEAINQPGIENTTRITPEGTWAVPTVSAATTALLLYTRTGAL